MTSFNEGRLTFSFPAPLRADQYDSWSFYRNQFNGAFGGTKAVDFICVDADNTWLIEVKDYRGHTRTKLIDMADEVALKVRDSLAGLAAAACNANDADERALARRAIKKRRLRVVLHLEQPRTASKLFPRPVDPSNLVIKLKQTLKAVDPHPVVVDQGSLKPEMSWTVAG